MSSSSDVVIRAEGLGKKYVIGHEAEGESYVALRDVLARSARGLVRSAKDLFSGGQMIAGENREDFWALKDIDFEIRRGEVVGVIGRNGAGKSTLLKILSRITEPTEGRVEIHGRVASLLEVGTGFHPELTGRENVYLNGAILGMSRSEIRRKFDEIVDFAEVEKFLDTPVKRYSSGMYVRLAFAVAAHLEPEILIVDEVLAVGDGEFQKKCLGKMGEVAGQGRTVLFVSHHMAAVERLCQTAMLMQAGRKVMQGPVQDVLGAYNTSSRSSGLVQDLTETAGRSGEGEIRFSRLEISGDGEGDVPITGKDLHLRLTLAGQEGRSRPTRLGLGVSNAMGVRLFTCSTEMTMAEPPNLGGGSVVSCKIPRLPLTGGRYLLTLFVEQDGVIQDWLPDALVMEVNDADFFGFGRNTPLGGEGQTLLVDHEWETGVRSTSRLAKAAIR